MNINFVKCYYYEIDVNFRHLSHKMTQYRFVIVCQFTYSDSEFRQIYKSMNLQNNLCKFDLQVYDPDEIEVVIFWLHWQRKCVDLIKSQ